MNTEDVLFFSFFFQGGPLVRAWSTDRPTAAMYDKGGGAVVSLIKKQPK